MSSMPVNWRHKHRPMLLLKLLKLLGNNVRLRFHKHKR